jgi:hypothetical protein
MIHPIPADKLLDVFLKFLLSLITEEVARKKQCVTVTLENQEKCMVD